MCGICGIAHAERGQPVITEQLLYMRDLLVHRGPDDAGYLAEGNIGIAHRRLSIVDLGSGHQPMSNEDGNLWIAFNGEIYNHLELRAPLERKGHVYKSKSDTETIIHLIEEDGPAACARLRGIFAFALWNRREQSLLLARDHTGIKPLYYAHTADGTLVFASEIKSIFASGTVRPEINTDVVHEHLVNGYVSGEATLFKGVMKLLPGTTLRWKDGSVEKASFWGVGSYTSTDTSTPPADVSAAANAFWSRFVTTVQSQLMSDVPLGVFLSGGLDSSMIVAAMREVGVQDIHSFSVGYNEQDASELPWARLVASRLNTTHHEVVIGGSEFFTSLPLLSYHRDLPLSFSASIPLYYVSKLASERVKVVLTGEGSDELFAGYGRYLRALINLNWAGKLDRALPATVRELGMKAAKGLGTAGGYLGSRIGRSFLANSAGFESSYLQPFSAFPQDLARGFLAPGVPTNSPFGDLNRLLDTDLFRRNPLEAMLRYDQQTYLEELLMKQDTMSMATSLESRVPFLDYLLVEWASTLPASVKLHNRAGKALVRNAAKGRLPDEVISGQKRGFTVPLAAWMRGAGANTLRQYLPSVSDALISRDAMERTIREHNAGHDCAAMLWRLLTFQLWREDTIPRMAEHYSRGQTSAATGAVR